jgi:hypothetical protein
VTEPTDPTESNADSDQPLTSAQEAELAEALCAAYRPALVDPELNEALIALALEEPLRPASEEERAESERFRRALEGHEEHPDLDLVRGLVEAHGPDRAEADDIQALNDRALDRALQSTRLGADASKPGKGNVIFVAFGVATALCAAAALLLVVAFPSKDSAPTAANPAAYSPGGVPGHSRLEPLTQSRSSEALFDAKFERDHTTERVDRIASVRARELRANRFQEWGVPGP